MCDSGTKRQLEYVAVKMPTSDACRKPGCDGRIEWLVGNGLPQCDRCTRRYWFREAGGDKAAITDAQTIAMLEAVVEAAQKGIAKARGAGRPKGIAEHKGNMIRIRGAAWWYMSCESVAQLLAEEINAAHEEEDADAMTIADFEAEVKTLSKTIRKQTRQCDCQHDVIVAQAKRIAGLTATPTPPADSCEAFEEWARADGYNATRDENGGYTFKSTIDVHAAWLAALEWRGSKPGDIAEARGNCVRFGGEGNDWFQVEYEGLASDIERAANKAAGCEGATP